MIVSKVMTLTYATNTTPNEMSTQYKCADGAARIWQHSIHKFSSALVTGIKDFIAVHSSTSSIQSRSGPIIDCDRPPNGRNLRKTGYHCDSIQEMIDSIVANGMVWSQQPGISQGWQGHAVSSKMLPSRLFDDTTMQILSRAELADEHISSSSSSTSGSVDIAFNEDARWRGVHPFNVKVKNIARFEALIPHGYRYARDLQIEAAFIPPPHHPRSSPGTDFVLQKKGTSAIPIVDPKTRSTHTTTTTFSFHQEVKHSQNLTPAAQDSFPGRSIDGMTTQATCQSASSSSSDPPLTTILTDTVTITELEVSAPKIEALSDSHQQSTPSHLVGHYSTCSIQSQMEVNSIGRYSTLSGASLVETVRRRTRRRQA